MDDLKIFVEVTSDIEVSFLRKYLKSHSDWCTTNLIDSNVISCLSVCLRSNIRVDLMSADSITDLDVVFD